MQQTGNFGHLKKFENTYQAMLSPLWGFNITSVIGGLSAQLVALKYV